MSAVLSSNRNDLADLAQLQAQFRIIGTLRFTAVCILIILFSALAGLSIGFVSMVPAMMLGLFIRDESIRASLALLVGSFLGALLVWLSSALWAQMQPLYVFVTMLWLFVFGYWIAQCMRGRWQDVAFPLSAALTLLTGVFADVSGAADGVAAASAWLGELPLGTLIFCVFSVALWPFPKRLHFDALVAAIRRECANSLRLTGDQVSANEAVVPAPQRLNLKYFADVEQMLSLNSAKFVGHEDERQRITRQLSDLSDVFTDVRYIQCTLENLPGQGFGAPVRGALADVIAGLANQIENSEIPSLESPLALLGEAEQRFLERARDGEEPQQTLEFQRLSVRIAGFVVAARSMSQKMLMQRPGLGSTAFAERTAPDALGWFMTDSLQAALKLVIGVLLGLALVVETGLPANAYLVFSILIILAQPNLGRAHNRVRLWFPGVIIGSLWALIGVATLSSLPYFGLYLLWFLPGLFLAGYLGLGPDRTSFIGMQVVCGMSAIMGLAVFPSETIIFAESRTLGAILGFLVALSLYHSLWPIHPALMLRDSLARRLRTMGSLVSRLSRMGEKDRPVAAIEALDADLAELRSQIQADIGLLDDFGSMMSKRVTPAYDYPVLLREVGLMSLQIWCLLQTASMRADDSEVTDSLKPLAGVSLELDQLLSWVAEQMASSATPRRDQVQAMIAPLHQRMREFRLNAAGSGATTERADYTINSIAVLLVHLIHVVDAMDGRAQP